MKKVLNLIHRAKAEAHPKITILVLTSHSPELSHKADLASGESEKCSFILFCFILSAHGNIMLLLLTERKQRSGNHWQPLPQLQIGYLVWEREL